MTPHAPPLPEPEPVPLGPEFYDLGRGYERDKRGMYGVDLSQPPGPPQRIAPKTRVRQGEKAIVSANNMSYNNYRPREYEARVPDRAYRTERFYNDAPADRVVRRTTYTDPYDTSYRTTTATRSPTRVSNDIVPKYGSTDANPYRDVSPPTNPKF